MSLAEPAASADLSAMLSSLELSREDEVPDLSLIEATYLPGAANIAFWNSVLEEAGAGSGALRSKPGRSLELYADAVSRHASSDAIVLSVVTSSGNFRHLSYSELDACATACAGAWSLAGLKPGNVVALVMPMGIEWLIAFAAALRLGLAISCLGSQGKRATLRRLRALEPDRVALDSAWREPLNEFAERTISVVSAGPSRAPPPHAYAAEQILGRLFSPVRAPVDEPVELSAQTAFLFALRDARFAYRLDEGGGLALPGFPPEQHQPAAVLATLLSGCRYVDLPLSAIAKNMELLAQPFITALGVSAELRDILRQGPAVLPSLLRGWCRSVDEPLDWIAWHDFVRKQNLQKVPVSNLLVDAASGGAVLIAARRPASVQASVLPSPGVPFMLSDIVPGTRATGDVGVFSSGLKADTKNPGWFLLARRSGEYLYGSTVSPRRAGRVFPADELVSCVSEITSVDAAFVVPVATGAPGAAWAFVLVVFVGALRRDAFDRVRSEIDGTVRAELGKDFIPDRVDLVPMYARFSDNKLDLGWCHRQYSAGFLSRKASHAVFQRLTALRASLGKDFENVR